jgi:hypothetical protein
LIALQGDHDERQRHAARRGCSRTTVIELTTKLVYGPYPTFSEARDHADAFEHWEIIRDDDALFDWSVPDRVRARARIAA